MSEPFVLTGDVLAQFRGCKPWNECFRECVDAAQDAIDEQTDPDEIREATEWARRQEWRP